jgi:three-Cys-motif partner protein
VLSRKAVLKFDEIGYWSEVKLDIINAYALEYSKILSAQVSPKFCHVYIDAFAGAGIHISKKTKSFVLGSPAKILGVKPSFCEYYFIDLDRMKAESLRKMAAGRKDVFVYEGDCNEILLKEVFPKVRFEEYRRGLCLLDPYGLHLNWDVIRAAGAMRSLEVLLNFPVADMHRNVLWRNPEGVGESDIARMNAFWGDDSWRKIAYTTDKNLFGDPEKTDIEVVAQAFRDRLVQCAGFAHVPKPIPMRNSKGAIVYYLFFASQNPFAKKIVEHIFTKYPSYGSR